MNAAIEHTSYDTSARAAPPRSASGQMLKGAEKAAVLFLCLGEDRGTALMKRLSDTEIRNLTHSMAGLGVIPAAAVEAVMREFGESVANGGSVVGSFSMAEAMLRKVLPEDQVGSILREIRGPLQERDLWARFSALNETSIANYLRSEHDQTAAAILSNLEANVAANVLPLLGEERMISIIERMVRMDAVPSHMMRQIEETLQKDIASVAAQPTVAERHKRLADLFNRLDNQLFEKLSPTLEDRMPEAFPEIRQRMFTFDDLIRLDATSLVRVMRTVEGNTLPIALKGAKDHVRDHFLSCLPTRSRDMLDEELQTMEQPKRKDTKNAQRALLDCARQLAAEDVIELPSPDDEAE
ncbi:flagellar motor switch protein FliG [Roseivivax sp. GX 12232]|uniref:flagellar motor switch protein FliG n=1 Tax=Roseivivax sp. GX 12232 TaxID=2900547 RepID=UPI001E2F1786|nr:flagellar motor switch protein FliG [Roseivivax sp. GX 12232]MCE0503879.1 flagellar motor switch protein FliG [Roseivivax sp. GX 12232]